MGVRRPLRRNAARYGIPRRLLRDTRAQLEPLRRGAGWQGRPGLHPFPASALLFIALRHLGTLQRRPPGSAHDAAYRTAVPEAPVELSHAARALVRQKTVTATTLAVPHPGPREAQFRGNIATGAA